MILKSKFYSFSQNKLYIFIEIIWYNFGLNENSECQSII